MKRILFVLGILVMGNLGFSQTIDMVSYHPSKYGNYDKMITYGDTKLATERGDVKIAGILKGRSSASSSTSVYIKELPGTAVPPVIYVGTSSDPPDAVKVDRSALIKGEVTIDNDLTVTNKVNNNELLGGFRTLNTSHYGNRSEENVSINKNLYFLSDDGSGIFGYLARTGSGTSLAYIGAVAELRTKKKDDTYWVFPRNALVSSSTLSWTTINYLDHEDNPQQMKMLIVN